MNALKIIIFFTAVSISIGQNIDPYNSGSKYAYGENVGWFNFKPAQGPGVSVRNGKITGYVWQENIGWINLSPANTNYGGLSYDSSRNVFGFAWGENVGWIKFNPTYGGVSIDAAGNFSGWAWGENIGWIHLASASGITYKVQACVVGMDDLMHFAQQWLKSGSTNPADLNFDNSVNFKDFSKFSEDWCDFCADNWLLKI